MQSDEPYCYRCRQTYGCICDGKKFTEASVMIRELESKLDIATKALKDIRSRSNPEDYPFVRAHDALIAMETK